MTKTELVKEIAVKTGKTQKVTKEFLEAAVEVAKEELINGGDITIPGFLGLKVVETPRREGTIMIGERKGEKYVTEAGHKVKLAVAKSLKEAVR